MYRSAFQLNREFIARICSKINELKEQHADDGHFSRLLLNTCPVSIDRLALIVDTAHWASQAIEEGDQLQFSIVFKEHEPSSNIFIFDHPLPLDSTNLVKLGSALESSFSDICVGPDGNGSVNIWGLRMRTPNDLTTDL
jgi:hypothetical protein